MPIEIDKINTDSVYENKRKCWSTNCKKFAFLEIVGWRYCFKHWRSDYRYGMCHGLWKALKWTKIIFK